MSKFIYIFFLMFIFSSDVHLKINTEKSNIKWEASKSNGSSHYGNIQMSSGGVKLDKNQIIGANFIIDMNSIVCTDIKDTSSNQYLISHLKNEDFFDTALFPEASMNIITVKKINDTNIDNYLITADLTILNQTHPIEFLSSIIIKKGIAMAEGKISINRAQYGIKYKSKSWFKDLGDRFINDIFYLYFSLVAMEDK